MASKKTAVYSDWEEEPKLFVLENIPITYNEELVTDYLESTLDVDVKEVKIYPHIPGRALVELEEAPKDFSEAVRAIKKSPLESKQVKLLRTKQKNAVVVNDIDVELLSEERLCLYLKSEFPDCQKAIRCSRSWPDLKLAVVKFHHRSRFREVVKNILAETHHVALPTGDYHIFISPFYAHFHDYITAEQSLDGMTLQSATNAALDTETDAHDIGGSLHGGIQSSGWNSSDDDDESSEDEHKTSRDKRGGKILVKQARKESGISANEEIACSRTPEATPRDDGKMSEKRAHYWMSKQSAKTTHGIKRANIHERSSCDNQYSQSSSDDNQGSDNFEAVQSRTTLSGFPTRQTLKRNRGRALIRKKDTKRRLSSGRMTRRGRRGSAFILPRIQKQTHENEYLHGSTKSKSSFSSGKNDGQDERYRLDADLSDNGHDQATSSDEVQSRDEDLTAIQQEFQKQLRLKEEKVKELEERVAHLTTNFQEKLDVTPWQAEMLPHCFGMFEECRVTLNSVENVAVFEGTECKVKEHQLKFLKELNNVKEELLTLTPCTLTLLNTERGKLYLKKNLLDLDMKYAKAFVHDEKLLVAANGNDLLKTAVDRLKQFLNCKETVSFQAKVPLEKLIAFKAKLEDTLLVKISWSENGKNIYIDGVKDDVMNSKKHVELLVEEFRIHETSFQLSGLYAQYFHRYMKDRIIFLINDEVEPIKNVFTDSQITIQFRGTKPHVERVCKKLQDLKENITSKCWDLKFEYRSKSSFILIQKWFSSHEMQEKLESFEIKEKCLVSIKLPSPDLYSRESTDQAERGASLRSPWPKSTKRIASSECRVSNSTFRMTDTCQLILKSDGDISREASEVLVCVVDQRNMDLRKTSVGLAFLRMCPALWKNLQAEYNAHPDDAVLTITEGLSPLKCKAICHVLLTPWNPDSSPAQLTNAIKLIVAKATDLRAKTISLPVLGYGRAFRFPAPAVAKIVLSCIASQPVSKDLEKIVLLTPDKQLFDQFKTVAPKHFKAARIQDHGSVDESTASESPSETSSADDDSDAEMKRSSKPVSISDRTKVTIVASMEKSLETLWSKFNEKIIQPCLYTHYFNHNFIDKLSKESKDYVTQEANKLGVWVENSVDPKTKKTGLMIKGTRANVDIMKRIVSEHVASVSDCVYKSRILSHDAPKRGTLEFMRFAAESNEKFPSYWTLSKQENMSRDSAQNKDSSVLVNVDAKITAAITKLITQTWDPQMVGQGADAKSLSHSGIKILSIKRVENPDLFRSYTLQRKRMFERMCSQQQVCTDIGNLPGSTGKVETTQQLADFMKEELYWEVNEHYLFHGTKAEFINAVIANGIDPKVTSLAAMFGRGIYTAEKFTKSDQYTDSRTKRMPLGTELNMILARVLLGNVFLCDHNHKTVSSKNAEKLNRPPCTKCLEDKCGCGEKHFDSVLGDGKWLFREFVVYEMSQCYPEYVIKYQRT